MDKKEIELCYAAFTHVEGLFNEGVYLGRRGLNNSFSGDNRDRLGLIIATGDLERPHKLLLKAAMDLNNVPELPENLSPNWLDRSRTAMGHFNGNPDRESLADYFIKLTGARILLKGQKLVGDEAVFPRSHAHTFNSFNLPALLDIIIKHKLTIRACRDYGEITTGRPTHGNRIIYDPLCCGDWIKDQKVNGYIGERAGECRFVSPGPCPECAVKYQQRFGSVVPFRE